MMCCSATVFTISARKMYTEMAVITAHTTPAMRQTSMLPDTGDQ